MAQELTKDMEYIANHIKEYIRDNYVFDAFDEDILIPIFSKLKLTLPELLDLLNKASPNVLAIKIYECTRSVTVSLQDLDEVIKLLKSAKESMEIQFLDGAIDVLIQTHNEISTLKEEKSNLEKSVINLQHELENAQEQIKNNDEIKNELNAYINSKDQRIAQLIAENNRLQEEIVYQRDILPVISHIKKCVNINVVYKFFEEISQRENKKMMAIAFEEGLCEKTYQSGKNILFESASRGNVKLLQSLIEIGCNKETRNSTGRTPLMQASIQNRIDVVKYLISIGANKEAKDNDGFTPLHLAVYSGYFDVFKYLHSIGANIKTKNNFGSTILHTAAGDGKLNVVKYLVQNDANIEAKDENGNTPLARASIKGQIEVFKYLISAGADKYAYNYSGITPLSCANSNIKQYIRQMGW